MGKALWLRLVSEIMERELKAVHEVGTCGLPFLVGELEVFNSRWYVRGMGNTINMLLHIGINRNRLTKLY